MDGPTRPVPRARPHLRHPQQLGHRVHRRPYPLHSHLTHLRFQVRQMARPLLDQRVQFIQLHMPEGQVPEEMSLNLVGVLTGAREPSSRDFVELSRDASGRGHRRSVTSE